MKGIILAGGKGTRLWPTTQAISKHLIPIYDKPLIYYPLSTLMLAGIREIQIVGNKSDIPQFKKLFGSGTNLGMSISYNIQERPEGIAQVFQISKDFIGKNSVALILGDNLFYGPGLGRKLIELDNPKGAIIFGYEVNNPQDYGVATLDQNEKIIGISEKPKKSLSKIAIPGLYFFDNKVVEYINQIKKSQRGEFEITSLLQIYLNEKTLHLINLPRGTAWMDCGTAESINHAANYVRVLEERQGLKFGCVEEIAYRNGWLPDTTIQNITKEENDSNYYRYLKSIFN